MLSVQLRTACASRRAQLAARLAATCSAPCAVLPAGVAQARNYPANTFPFRASSHFLYLVGVGLEGCTLWLSATGATLFVPERHPFDDLWHGPVPTFAELELALGLEVRPLSELSAAVQGQDFACPPLSLGLLPPELRRKREQSEIRAAEADLELAEALVSLRLTHDAAALTEIRRAVTVSIDAHRAGIRATRQSAFEREVQAAMEP